MKTFPRLSVLLGVCALISGLFSCTKEEQDPAISLTPETLHFTEGVTLQSFEISTNRAWSIDLGGVSWVSVSPQQGESGTTTVQVTVEENPSFSVRECTLSVSAEGKKATCTIRQDAGLQAPEGSELAALIAIYNQMNGPNWKAQENWLTDKPIGEWEGIRTDDQGHVLVIYMYANNLSGEIPDEIGNLPYLEKLYFSHDALTGSIPETIGNLTNLQILDLTVNKLTGSIPASIGNLTKLQTLALNDNAFSGSIPEAIGQLTELTSMTLHKNQIYGSLPESIGNLRQLAELNLSYNNLSGSLPESMGNMQALASLQLQRNQLTGGLPEGFAQLTSLETCDLSFNCFNGVVPDDVMALPYYDGWIPSPQRSGFGFSNLNDNLESDDYSQDGQVITYAEPMSGRGFNLIFMGDGFTSQEMDAGGQYESKMIQGIEALFQYEPYKTYRNYFNVYIVKVVSPQSGVSQPGYSRNSRLKVTYADESSSKMSLDADVLATYAAKVPGYAQMTNCAIAVIANSKRHGGTTYFNSQGSNYAIGTLASSFETTLVHELGGHAIGKLGDEYTGGHTIPDATASSLKQLFDQGYYLNLDLTDDPQKVHWASLIGLPGYEMVGTYEGGYMYAYGVWRSESNSIMKQSGSGAGFNTYSRLLIVKRILNSAGESYTLEKFLANDVIPPSIPANVIWQPAEPHTPPIFLP